VVTAVFLLILQFILWMLAWLVPNALALWVVYYLLSLPLRRQERGRFFVDLVDGALARGNSVEQEIVEVSATRDRSMGVRFHWLASLLEAGQPLGRALEGVPGFLSARLRGLLLVGMELGDLRRVMPACRRATSDAMSSVQGASNYAVLTFQALSPVAAAIVGVLLIFVFPKFMAIMADMGTEVPPFLVALVRHSPLVLWGLVGLCLVVYGLVLVYVVGSYLEEWARRRGWGWIDRLTWYVPWRRYRLQRDYVGLLSLLMDGGMSERESLEVAARGIQHTVLRGLVSLVGKELAGGRSLVQAMRRLDASGELAWRMENAAGARRGFGVALAGWLEALDARAYQSQPWVSQVVTTLLVLCNGFLVGFVVLAVFQPLIAMINSGLLW